MYIYEKKVNKAKITIVASFAVLVGLASLIFIYDQNQTSTVSNQESLPVKRLQLPRIETDEIVGLPFNINASTQTHFFDITKEASVLENSVVEFEGVYRPSQGVDYSFNNKVFEVVAMVSGTVIEVADDNLMGQSITVESADNLIITYQSLSAQFVQIGDVVSQGMLIGYAGENLYNQALGIHLHLVCVKDDKLIDPESIIGSTVAEIE